MPTPRLSVEATPRGVDRIVVHVDRRDAAGGLDLLRRLLPGIREIDRHARSRERRTPARREEEGAAPTA
jgi:hypothetical protein